MTNNTAATTRLLNIILKYVEVLCFFFALRLLVMMLVRPVLSVTVQNGTLRHVHCYHTLLFQFILKKNINFL